jgi:hypothetical protein
MIAIHVIFRAGITILQFLGGCVIIFLGYMVLGCCLFGSFADRMSGLIRAAEILIAITHGDVIQDSFTAITWRGDISEYVGFVYMFIWVFFSFTILFNIVIAFFEEALTTEIYGMAQRNQDGEGEWDPRSIGWTVNLDALRMARPPS